MKLKNLPNGFILDFFKIVCNPYDDHDIEFTLDELREEILKRMSYAPKFCHCGNPVAEDMDGADYGLCKDCQGYL